MAATTDASPERQCTPRPRPRDGVDSEYEHIFRDPSIFYDSSPAARPSSPGRVPPANAPSPTADFFPRGPLRGIQDALNMAPPARDPRQPPASSNRGGRPPPPPSWQALAGPAYPHAGSPGAPPVSFAPPQPAQYSPVPASPYGQTPGYLGQYTMAQSAPPYPPHSYAYAHPAIHVHDPSMLPQHPYSQSPLAPPPHAPYQFPRFVSDASSPTHSFPGASSPTAVFAHTTPPPGSPLGASNPSRPPAPPSAAGYGGQTPYYPPAVSAASYSYAMQAFAPSPPLYQTPPFQTPHAHYQHQPPYATPPEPDGGGGGGWWYMHPMASRSHQHQHQHQQPYAPAFAGFSPAEYPLSAPPASAAVPVPATMYPFSPSHRSPQFMSVPGSSQGQGSTPSLAPSDASPGAPAGASVRTQSATPASPTSPGPEPHSPGGSGERPALRKPYHPKPPQNRSEWVMWAGNVPADASHDELWRFFTQPASQAGSGSSASASGGTASAAASGTTPAPAPQPPPGAPPNGVSSLHLISRSNCAFVNFDTEAHLHAAIARFDGLSVRPGDPRCPRLVCRVRRREDDLKAGVGAQRGTGIHTKWVKERREEEREGRDGAAEAGAGGEGELTSESEAAASPTSARSDGAPPRPAQGPGHAPHAHPYPHHAPGTEPRHQSSGSGSYASTNSSMLASHFPRRFFILKSLTQYDLDLSVQKGLWATQRHNEGILDQAFRTSKDVFLIFGVNKSGEFYGYARMAGPIHGERRISWASTSADASPQQSISSRGGGRGSGVPPVINEGAVEDHRSGAHILSGGPLYFSPGEERLIEESPQPWSPAPPPPAPSRFVRNHTATDPFPHSPLPPGAAFASAGAHAHAGSAGGLGANDPSSAPAQLQRPHHTFSAPLMEPETAPAPERIRAVAAPLLAAASSLPGSFDLDPDAPARAQRERQEHAQMELEEDSPPPAQQQQQHHGGAASLPTGHGRVGSLPKVDERGEDAEGVKRRDTLDSMPRRREVPVAGPSTGVDGDAGAGKGKGRAADGAGAGEDGVGDVWGGSFKVEWVQTERLPFWRTRHIRNPWNQDREVKVSRDGTELEPAVGQQLLDEWERPDPPQSPGFKARRPLGNRTASAAATTPAAPVFGPAPPRGGGGGGGGGGMLRAAPS